MKADWRVVAHLDDLSPGRVLGVEVEGRALALCRDGDRVFAVDDRCPHRGAPFSEMGHVQAGVLTCEWHWWRFDLGTGRHCDVPRVCLARYPVRIAPDGAVEVDISGPLPHR